MNVQRYTWLDAIIEAEATEKINKEANTAHRLAHAITWEPSDGRPSGLYWANELAADVCGVPRATFYRHIKVLKAEGFFTEEKGNLLPALPESQNETRELFEQRRQALVDAYNAEAKSHNETKTGVKTGSSGAKSHNDTSKSQNETGESQNDNPYSVDTYPVDEYTVEEKTTAVADAPSVPSNLLVRGSGEVLEDTEDFEIEWDIEDHPLTTKEQAPALTLDVEEAPKSQNETEEDNEEDAGMEDSMTKVLNWNRENRPWLTREWDAVEKILADPTYLSNETDCGKKLDAAIQKAHLMAWAS